MLAWALVSNKNKEEDDEGYESSIYYGLWI